MNKDYLYFYNKVCGSDVPPTARMVYIALLHYANRKTWSCFPSVKTIMKDTGLCERAVRKQISYLVEKEYLIRISRTRKDNGCSSNLYFFN